jgi:hypothetical protein
MASNEDRQISASETAASNDHSSQSQSRPMTLYGFSSDDLTQTIVRAAALRDDIRSKYRYLSSNISYIYQFYITFDANASLQKNVHVPLYSLSDDLNKSQPYVSSLIRNHSNQFIGLSCVGLWYPMSSKFIIPRFCSHIDSHIKFIMRSIYF